MKRSPPATLDPLVYGSVIDRALREDLGDQGDVTTTAVVPPGTAIKACLATREAGRVAGLPAALEVFRRLDPEICTRVVHDDGADVGAGTMIAALEGPAHPILTGERTALNILTRLCGIATATRRVVEAIQPYPTRVACTRKTTPGLRALEKYAVRVGGGANHRSGLYDGVLIKDNHIVAAGGLRLAVERGRAALGGRMKIEVEIDSLDQLALSIEAGADTVLLDNMTPDQVREAVRLAAGRVVTEASGGIRLDNVRAYAATGVDIISLGWLTHSTAGLDIGLDFERV